MNDQMKTQRFDAAQYLDDPAVITAYLAEAIKTGDDAFVAQAVETVVSSLRTALAARGPAGNEFPNGHDDYEQRDQAGAPKLPGDVGVKT